MQVRPFDFADMPALVRDLEGATTLYNTYWVRFARGETTHAQAVENSRTLFHAGAAGRCAAHRAHQHHQPDDRVALPVLPRQGARRARARRDRYVVRDPAARDPVRGRRCAGEQHRLAPAAPSGVRGRRPRRLPHPPDPRRRPRRPVPRRGGRYGRHDHRRRRTRTPDVPGARTRDPRRGRQPRARSCPCRVCSYRRSPRCSTSRCTTCC